VREWKSRRLNRMARRHQPDILISDRSLEPQDFDTSSEAHVRGADLPPGRDWEACMQTTGCRGYNREWRGTARLPFEQTENHLVIRNLPRKNAETSAGVPVIKIGFDKPPTQGSGIGYVIFPFEEKRV
jgi:hypothetical protein